MRIGQMAQMTSMYQNLMINNNNLNKTVRNLSTGYRINSAADDAAGLAISEKMRGQIRGLDKSYENSSHALNMTQTAGDTLQGSNDIVTRMKELAVQASNGTLSDADRSLINTEFQSLKGELDRIAGSTHYNGQNLLDGSLGGQKGMAGIESLGITDIAASGNLSGAAKFNVSTANGVTSITAQIGNRTVTNQIGAGDTSTVFDFGGGNTLSMDFAAGGLSDGVITKVGVSGNSVNTNSALTGTSGSSVTFQVGANNSADQRMTLSVGDMSSVGLGIYDLDISTVGGANNALSALEGATNAINSQRAVLGATETRLEHTMSNLSTASINMQQSESTIRDVDMAKELMNFTQNSIKSQASLAMMAQSMNLARTHVLGLLLR